MTPSWPQSGIALETWHLSSGLVGEVYHFDFSQDERLVAILAWWGKSYTEIYDLHSRKCLIRFGELVQKVAFAPSRNLFVPCTSRGFTVNYIQTGVAISKYTFPSGADFGRRNPLTILPDGSVLAAAISDSVVLVEMDSGKEIERLQVRHGGDLTFLSMRVLPSSLEVCYIAHAGPARTMGKRGKIGGCAIAPFSVRQLRGTSLST